MTLAHAYESAAAIEKRESVDAPRSARTRSEHGAVTVAVAPQITDRTRDHATRGRFTRGNQLASKAYRETLQRDPHRQVRRWLRSTITALRTGKMAPGVALALIAALKLELELIDRTQTTATIEGLQNEVGVLSAQLRDLLAEQAAR